MKRTGLSLLSLLTVTELMLATAGLVAAGMLVTSTSRLHELAGHIASAVESVYAAEHAERALLMHSQRSYLHELTGQPEHLHQRDRAREEFTASIQTLHQHVGSEQERKMLQQAEIDADLYFRRRDELELKSTSPDMVTTSMAGILEEAQSSLSTLVQINYEQSRAFRQRIESEDALATRIGIAAAGGVMVILGSAFLLLDRSLRRPLIHLTQQMRGLDAGKLSLIEPRGPSELQEIGSVFNELVSSLQQQRDSRLRFLAGIAHDLRTPLNAIKLSAQCMEGENLDREQRDTLSAIERQVNQLDHQVSDLLDTTRVESGQLALRPSMVDLGQLVEDAVNLFRGTSERHTVTFTRPPDAVLLQCDATRIGQVVNNLISNAIKYSPAGGDVSVSLSHQDGGVILDVRDEGIGIGPEDLPHIFEPFRRTASTRETIPGVGLGLSVARRIVEAHGGSIQASSARGTGSTFSLRFPAPAS